MTKRDGGKSDGARATGFRVGVHEFTVLSVPLQHAEGQTTVFAKLSTTEREVARLLVKGLSHREIAHARGCAVRTIANHAASIYRKLEVRGRLELSRLQRGVSD